MKPRKSRLNPAQREWLRDWWRALQPRDAEKDQSEPLPGLLLRLGRGERARLRRCADLEDLLNEPATLPLIDQLIARNGEQGALPDEPLTYQRMAWVAGVLALVKSDLRDGRSLAWHLGHGVAADQPVMSELRFRCLQRSSKIDELFLQWRRAVQLADGKVDVAQLADDLLSWQWEQDTATSGAHTVKFRWAHDYYLTAREQAGTDESAPSKELKA